MSSKRVTERTDFDRVTPQRLKETIDYGVLNRCSDFTHRGITCDVDRLVGRLGGCLDSLAIEEGDSADPSTLTEYEAVNACIEALESMYKPWFGGEESLELLDEPYSDEHISTSDLRSDYWQDTLTPDQVMIEGDSWRQQKRITVPLAAIFLKQVEYQQAADRQKRRQIIRSDIRKTIISAAHEDATREEDIGWAINDALEQLGYSQS